MALWKVSSAFVHHGSYIIFIVSVVERRNFYDTNQDFSFRLNLIFVGVPNPPTNRTITNCFKRTTTFSWVTGAANNASITQFVIEQESSYEPNVFYIIQNVINPNATSFAFNLTGWATLRFRTLLQTPNLKGQKPSSVCPFTLHQCGIVRPTRRWKPRSFDF